MNTSQIKTICFDYYGTLVDIGKPFKEIENWFVSFLNEQRNSVSIQQFSAYFTKQRAKYLYNPHFHTGNEILEKSYVSACQKFALKPYINDFITFVSNLFTMPTAYENAVEAVSILRQKYKVGLVTNADDDILQKSLENTRFDFDFIITSEYAQSNKPNSRIFEMALQQEKTSSNQVIMIGDSLSEDIYGAQRLGINAIWINRENKMCHNTVVEVKEIDEILRIL